MLNTIIKHFESAVGWPYKSPGTNDERGIDCSGLFVYALSKINKKIYHGSNRIARKYCNSLEPINNNVQLGDVLFKSRPSGSKLSPQYKKGGKYYNEQLPWDFYHIGLVTRLKPLRIVHATPPAVKADNSLKGWSHRARLNLDSGVCPTCGKEW
ncbi:MAG: hypothetical protein GYA87_02840 [Christensenellaceae bacterium]|nr:hypothetical protein [Christensenellaceae bacterium]